MVFDKITRVCSIAFLALKIEIKVKIKIKL